MTQSVDWMKARNKAWATRRKRDIIERDRERTRKSFDSGHIAWSTLPETRVLTGWHIDSTGCRARTVGNES